MKIELPSTTRLDAWRVLRNVAASLLLGALGCHASSGEPAGNTNNGFNPALAGATGGVGAIGGIGGSLSSGGIGTGGAAGTVPTGSAGQTGSAASDAGSQANGSAGHTGGASGSSSGVSGAGGMSGAAGAGGTAGAGVAGSAGGTWSPCPSSGAPCKVLPFGDSITYGVGSEAQGGGGYRVDLFSRAVMASKKLTFVGTQMNGPAMVAGMPFPQHHAGYSGYTIAQITAATLFNAEVATAPNIVLLHIGTNDMLRSDGPTAPQRLATLVDNLTTALPNALIVVAQIIPLNSGMTQVKTYNSAIAPLIDQRAQSGKHVVLVDQNTGFPTAGLGSDGIHPNAMGYQYMAGVWFGAIGSRLP